jgi:hypothetical protein
VVKIGLNKKNLRETTFMFLTKGIQTEFLASLIQYFKGNGSKLKEN